MRCTFSTDKYTLTGPNEGLTAGTYYLKISTRGQTTNGVVFPTTFARQKLTAIVNDGTTDASSDVGYLSPAPTPFSAFSVANWNAIADSQGYLIISLTLPAAIPADAATAEQKLVLEFATDYYDKDLGASTATFATEGISYKNGMLFPLIATASLTDIQAGLMYGDTTTSPSTPAKIVLRAHTAAYPTAAVTFKLPFIKNPSSTGAMSIKAYFVEYASSTPYPVVSYMANYPAYDIPLTAVLSSPGSPAATSTPATLTPQITATVTFSNLQFTPNPTQNPVSIYVKFKTLAQGWKYSSITTVTCGAYTIDFFPSAYLFVINSVSVATVPFSITNCGTFTTADYVLTPITFELGIYAVGNRNLNTYTVTLGMSATPSVPSTQTETVASGDYDNTGSVTKVTLTFAPSGSYKITGGGRIRITYTTANSLIFPGYPRTECAVAGLTDLGGTATGPKRVSCYHDSTNNELNIVGFGDSVYPGASTIVVTYFMKIGSVTTINCNWWLYDHLGNLYATTGSFTPALNYRVTADYDSFSTFGYPSYLLYPLPIYSTTTAPLIFTFSVANTLTYDIGTIEVTLPADFSFATDGVETYYYSTTGGASWVPTTGSFVASVATIDLIPGFPINAGTTIYLYLTTEGAPGGDGMVYPAAGMQTFTLATKISGTQVEGAYYEYVLPPSESSGVTFSIYLLRTSASTVVEAKFTTPTGVTASPNDRIDMQFRTHNLLNNLWPINLGMTFTIDRAIAACAQIGGSYTLSDTPPLSCLAYNVASAGSNNYASVSGLITKAVPENTAIRFFVAGITNPSTNGVKAPVKLRITTPCRFDGYQCPKFQSSFAYGTTNTVAASGVVTVNAPTIANAQVKQTNQKHTFTLTLTNTVTATDGLVVKPNTAYYNIAADCISTSGKCASFPTIGWVFYQPTSTMPTGTNAATFDITLDNPLFVDDAGTNFLINIETYRLVNGGTGRYSNSFQAREPTYTKIPISGSSNTEVRSDNPNPAYPAYYLLNFANVFKLVSPGLYKDSSTVRIEYVMDNNYSPLTTGYCEAYIQITTPIAYNKRLDCATTGARSINVYLVYDTWQTGYDTYNLVIFASGFHSHLAYYGSITEVAYADYNLNLAYRAYQSTQTVTVVNDPLTPILTEVVFQEKMYMDRRAKVGDQIEFMGMMKPFSPQSTKQFHYFIFTIDSAFTYPPVTSLLCHVKGYTDDIRPCTLQRTLGQTIVTINVLDTTTPYTYDHTAKKLTIGNLTTQYTFYAPNREGLYTLDAKYTGSSSSTLYELGTTTMQVDGGKQFELLQLRLIYSFLLALVKMTDFQVEHLKNSQLAGMHIATYVLGTRDVPIGYELSSSNVKTDIILQFQIYPLPGFAYDLGTGLTNGSEIGCAPYAGMTGK